MQRRIKKHLWDIRHACENILRYAGGKSYDDYLADDMLRDAVERNFVTIGEAINRTLAVAPEFKDRFAGCAKIVSFRNKIVHEYDVIDNALVWDVIENHLETLLGDVRALLPSEEDPQLDDITE